MPSDSVAGFLDHAKASRVLFPEQVEQLYRQPDLPRSDLGSLCDYLLARGVITRFQADAIREDRNDDLSFGGYSVIDVIGQCPGGTEYTALHPSLRTPLVLRRLRADWLSPDDAPADYVSRARAIGMLAHPNIVHLLDAGVFRDELYLVIESPTDSVDLDELTNEIGGAMPGFLAAEYGRAVASALRLAHERGGVHGDVRPCNLWVGPLVVKVGEDGIERRRPAPHATVRLAELGLVPVQTQQLFEGHVLAATAYLPPERLMGAQCDSRSDIYGLGATLYFLLAGRPPFVSEKTAELLNCIRSSVPDPLTSLRPDLPQELADLITQMMHKLPEKRPLTMADVEAGLARFCRPGVVQAEVIPEAAPASSTTSTATAAVPVTESADVWGIGSGAFSMASTERTPRRRELTSKERGRGRLLLILGGVLHLTAIALLIAWAVGAFEPAPVSDPGSKPSKKDTPPPKKKKTQNPDD